MHMVRIWFSLNSFSCTIILQFIQRISQLIGWWKGVIEEWPPYSPNPNPIEHSHTPKYCIICTPTQLISKVTGLSALRITVTGSIIDLTSSFAVLGNLPGNMFPCNVLELFPKSLNCFCLNGYTQLFWIAKKIKTCRTSDEGSEILLVYLELQLSGRDLSGHIYTR